METTLNHRASAALTGMLAAYGNCGTPHQQAAANESQAVAALLVSAPPVPVFLAVYIAAVNDTNGNPRRGWYVSRLDGAGGTAWIEEGYGNFPWPLFASILNLPAVSSKDYFACRDAARPYVHETGRINVTPGEYRDARKLPRFGGGA